MKAEISPKESSSRFFFPLLFLTPPADMEPIVCPPFTLRRRLWGTSTFDLATLATKHRLHLPYQLMDVLLSHCNVELEIRADRIERAADSLNTLLLGLYIVGVSPTVAPFATTYSINDYSGINSRDTDSLRMKLPPELLQGLTSEKGTLEAWPVDLSVHCHLIPDAIAISALQFQEAATRASKWAEIEHAKPSLRVVRDAAQAAPLLASTDQSLLHIWCAIEALFSTVSAEVSFRVALYLAQLTARGSSRQSAFRAARKAYNLRSKVAHGSYRGVSHEEWLESWRLLLAAANAVVERGELPGEEQLLDELLTSGLAIPDGNATS